jgi:hypothetical protein
VVVSIYAGGCKADAPFTIVLAGANYTRQHANFCVSVQIVFGLVYWKLLWLDMSKLIKNIII